MAENRRNDRNNRRSSRDDVAVTFRDGQPVYKRDSQKGGGRKAAQGGKGRSEGRTQYGDAPRDSNSYRAGRKYNDRNRDGAFDGGEYAGVRNASRRGAGVHNTSDPKTSSGGTGDYKAANQSEYRGGRISGGNRDFNRGGYRGNTRNDDRGEYRGEYRGNTRNDDRGEYSGEYRGNTRNDGRGEYRGGYRGNTRNDDRGEYRGEYRGNTRNDDRGEYRGKNHSENRNDRDDNRIRTQPNPAAKDAGRNNEPLRNEAAQAEVELPNIIMGRNPVKEAIKSGRSIDRILVVKEHDGSLNEILDIARDSKLVVRDVERSKLDEICMPFGHNGKTGNHQGIIAYIPEVEYCEISDILELAKERGEEPFIVLLDGVEDPHNLGSVIRSAECAGAHGVVITKRRSASVTAAVIKSSAGATEHMLIAKVVNLSIAMERLKEAGVWITGADMGGEPLYSANLKGPFALVVGAEGAGLSRLVKERCDYTVSIPLKGKLESLNASVAAAIIMFEKVRQEQK